MRVMAMIKATPKSEAGVMPEPELFEAMGKFNEELIGAGVMQAGEGLHPSSKGVRVRFWGGENSVTEGPFEGPLVAGFWIWKVASMEEAIEWARKCPNPMPGEEAEIELRRVFEEEDFANL